MSLRKSRRKFFRSWEISKDTHWKLTSKFLFLLFCELLVHFNDFFSSIKQVHRVLIPEEEIKRRVPRRSLVLFHDPDDDTMVTCLDGSNKYPPIRARDWIYHQLHSTYKYWKIRVGNDMNVTARITMPQIDRIIVLINNITSLKKRKLQLRYRTVTWHVITFYLVPLGIITVTLR